MEILYFPSLYIRQTLRFLLLTVFRGLGSRDTTRGGAVSRDARSLDIAISPSCAPIREELMSLSESSQNDAAPYGRQKSRIKGHRAVPVERQQTPTDIPRVRQLLLSFCGCQTRDYGSEKEKYPHSRPRKLEDWKFASVALITGSSFLVQAIRQTSQ